MVPFLILVLIVLWILGYVNISGLPDVTLFMINGQPITLWNILILAVVGWAIGILPTPFREISGVLLVLWVLSVLGILSIAGVALASMFILAIIIGLIASLFLAATKAE
jgi:hypothetical protein